MTEQYAQESPEELKLHSSSVRAAVWAKSNGQCWYCGKQTNPWDDFCIDHLIPRSQGGASTLYNLFPCCQSCNSQKNGRNLREYRAYLSVMEKPKFTAAQTRYLFQIGVNLDAYPDVVEDVKQHAFWFEYECLHRGIPEAQDPEEYINWRAKS